MSLRITSDWKGDRVTGRARNGAVNGLRQGAEHVLGESRKQVPHETGTLQRSGGSSVDEIDLAASVYYDTPYAARQHEELTWRHGSGRKAKYLEDPMRTESDTVAALVQAAIRREMGT